MEHEVESTLINNDGEAANISDMLEKVINHKGLIVVNTEKLLDTRPLSLVMASRLSTGHPLGEFSIPLMDSILHIEGQMGQKEVQDLLENSALDYASGKIHYFSFATLNSQKETDDEPDVYLANPECGVHSMVGDLGCNSAVIHDFATVSNHFLDHSEKDSIKAIQKLQAKNAAVIVFVENGTKGSALLQSMADVVFEVTRANNKLDAPINIVCAKHPSFEINPPKPFCLSLSVNEGKWAVIEESDPDEILSLVISLACRGKTQVEIGSFIGLEQYQISRLLKKAEDQGLISRNGRTVRRIK